MDATRTWVGVGEREVLAGFDYVGIFREMMRGALEGVAGVDVHGLLRHGGDVANGERAAGRLLDGVVVVAVAEEEEM